MRHIFFPVFFTLAVLSFRIPSPGEVLPETSEPPRRIEIAIGDERHLVDLDGDGIVLDDGRKLEARSVATRGVTFPGQFRFEYQEGWRYSSSRDHRDTGLGWWNFIGSNSSFDLRRHDGDPDEIARRYVENMRATGATDQRRMSFDLGGRRLEGFAVDLVVPGLFAYPDLPSTQYVFGFRGPDGQSWLLTIHRTLPLALHRELEDARWMTGSEAESLQARKDLLRRQRASRELETDPELTRLLQSFRWQD